MQTVGHQRTVRLVALLLLLQRSHNLLFSLPFFSVPTLKRGVLSKPLTKPQRVRSTWGLETRAGSTRQRVGRASSDLCYDETPLLLLLLLSSAPYRCPVATSAMEAGCTEHYVVSLISLLRDVIGQTRRKNYFFFCYCYCPIFIFNMSYFLSA